MAWGLACSTHVWEIYIFVHIHIAIAFLRSCLQPWVFEPLPDTVPLLAGVKFSMVSGNIGLE